MASIKEKKKGEMENSLILQIKNAVIENDTESLKQFIRTQPKADLTIDKNILHYLKQIVIDSINTRDAVNCVLSCIKFFCEQKLEENVWETLAKEFAELCVICLKLCVGLNSKYEAEDSLLIYLSEIVFMLVEQCDLIVKAFHYLLLQPLFKIVTEKHFSFKAKYSIVKTIACVVKSSDEDNHNQCNSQFRNEIATFSNWILLCGDYEIQTDILETLLYILFHCGSSNKSEFCSEWFHLYPEIREDLISRDFTDFEPQARIFLNLVNTLNRNQLIFSIGCVCAFSDGTKLQKPNDSNYSSFWIDFNVCSESVIICHQGNESWDTIKLEKKSVLEVFSASGEYNIKGELTPIVKLCFNLSSVVNVVEIWFEMSEQFLNVENHFLIPIFGHRYQSNWKRCQTDNTLSNEIFPLRKYMPLSVVINPRKSIVDENPKTTESIETVNEKGCFNSSVYSQSNLISDGGMPTVDSNHYSSDEIESTPKTISTSKKCSTRFQHKSSLISGSKSTIVRQEKNKKEIEIAEASKNINTQLSKKTLNGVEESVKNSTHKVKPDHNESKITNNVSSLKKSKNNQTECTTESTKRKKLFYSPENSDEYNTNSPLYDINQPYTEVNPCQNTDTRVSYSYRTYKDRPLQSIIQEPDSRKFFNVNSDELTISQDSVFEENKVNSPVTPNNKINTYQYSDLSSSGNLKSIKKTYKTNKKKIKKRQRKAKLHLASDFDPDFIPGKSLAMSGIVTKKNETRNSYVSRLEKAVDPLRDKEPEANCEHEIVSEIHVDEDKQKELNIGENIFTSFEIAQTSFNLMKNKYVEDEFINDPYHSNNISKMEHENVNSIKVVECSEPKLKNAAQNKYREKKRSNTKLQDRKVSEIMTSSPKTSVIPNKNNPTKHSSRYETLLLSEFPKMINETKAILKSETETIAADFISKLEFQQNNILLLSLEIDKCKKSLEEINNEIKNMSKIFNRSMLQLQSQHSKILEKYLKSFKADMKKYAMVPIEEEK